jgi:hypothetical protein
MRKQRGFRYRFRCRCEPTRRHERSFVRFQPNVCCPNGQNWRPAETKKPAAKLAAPHLYALPRLCGRACCSIQTAQASGRALQAG